MKRNYHMIYGYDMLRRWLINLSIVIVSPTRSSILIDVMKFDQQREKNTKRSN